jgi:hypothetical protein
MIDGEDWRKGTGAIGRANTRLEAAGLPPLPKLTPHSLRRTFCSALYALGEDPGTVMDEMGHTNPALALHVYRQAMHRGDDEQVRLKALAEGAGTRIDPAPHQANKRFPCRRGTTTDYLDQREVERLYRQRQELSGPPPEPGSLLDRDFVSGLDGFSVSDGTGALALVVRPAAKDVNHPAGAWQKDALTLAVRAAIQRQAPRLGNSSLIRSAHALADWQPRGAEGWQATNAGAGNGTIAPQVEPHTLIAGCLSYPACLSFMVLLGLRWERAMPSRNLRSAREVDLLYELVVLLAISGEYFSDVSGGAHLFAEARLSGFAGAKSQMVIGSGSTGDLEAALRPPAPDGLTQAVPYQRCRA